ncbi:prefoldin subunit alpha [Candidatus Woesearchaeota archaeon]|nr:prefoldin subunit alpha [Candidatus Woesearchaeota archaeon]
MGKEDQQKYLELQMLDQQIKQIQKNLELIDNQISELAQISQSLEELRDVKPGTEAFVPITGGVFIKAEIKDSKNLLVNVGAGATVEKSVPDTIDLINNQKKEIESAREELLEQLKDAVKKARELQGDLATPAENSIAENKSKE